MKKSMNTPKEQFIPREPVVGIGGRIDKSHIRFVDTATSSELRAEYQLIKEKKSKLPRKQREIISRMFA